MLMNESFDAVGESFTPYHKIPRPMTMIHQSRQGIGRKAFNRFARDIRRPVLDLAEILPSSYSTLTKKEVFDKATSQQIILLQKLFAYGTEVFGDIDIFNEWLDIELGSLEGVTPFSILDTSFGIELIEMELYKIDHGLPV